jgi:hypothetical protein
MKSYIFITTEGDTFQPGSVSSEPDIENCQVIGFAKGIETVQAFETLVRENSYLLATAFDEVICLELKHADCLKHKTYFHLSEYKTNLGQQER